MQTDDPSSYSFTTEVVTHIESPPRSTMITTAYAIDDKGLWVTRAGSARLIPWTSIRFLHVHVTSGVGTTGFPVYSARLRMLFASREITSLHWQGEKRTDQSADYVRFMEKLIPFAVARNPRLRLRYGGDPMLEAVLPRVLTLFVAPVLIIPFLVFKPLGALVSGLKFGGLVKKSIMKPLLAAVAGFFGVVLNMLPWSSGKQFKADDLPTAELPPKYRQAGV